MVFLKINFLKCLQNFLSNFYYLYIWPLNKISLTILHTQIHKSFQFLTSLDAFSNYKNSGDFESFDHCFYKCKFSNYLYQYRE